MVHNKVASKTVLEKFVFSELKTGKVKFFYSVFNQNFFAVAFLTLEVA